MDDTFRPFTQISRPNTKRILKSLNKGKSAQLVLYFLTEMNHEGIVEATYSHIMAATGMGSATVSSLLLHLANVGFMVILDDDPYGSIGRYQVNQEIARFPLGTSETKVSNGKNRTHTFETKVTPYFVVVKDSIDHSKIDLETATTTTSKKHFQNESAAASKTEVPADPRLCRLWTEHKMANEFAPEVFSSWIARYGLETVYLYTRWYLYARDTGKARGGGWLNKALALGYSKPDGFRDDMYLSEEERLARYNAEW